MFQNNIQGQIGPLFNHRISSQRRLQNLFTICVHSQLEKGKFSCQTFVHSIRQVIEGLITKFFLKTIMCFWQGQRGRECGFCIKVQLVVEINNPNNIHELLTVQNLHINSSIKPSTTIKQCNFNFIITIYHSSHVCMAKTLIEGHLERI